jgi:hypothetical protein
MNDLDDQIITRLEERIEVLEAALERIVAWSEAYPLAAFPEPDFSKAARLLEDGGMTLDAVSASNTRHVVKRVAEIAREALGKAQIVT